MIEDKAKEAAAARAELAQVLQIVAATLSQLANVMAASSVELTRAIEQEHAATLAYVSALEAELSRQKMLN